MEATQKLRRFSGFSATTTAVSYKPVPYRKNVQGPETIVISGGFEMQTYHMKNSYQLH